MSATQQAVFVAAHINYMTMKKDLLKQIGIYAGIALLFVIIAYGFVPQVLNGKIVNQHDISGWKGMAKEALAHNKANPEDPTAWTNSMFGGMPTTAIVDSFYGVDGFMQFGRQLFDKHFIGFRGQISGK